MVNVLGSPLPYVSFIFLSYFLGDSITLLFFDYSDFMFFRILSKSHFIYTNLFIFDCDRRFEDIVWGTMLGFIDLLEYKLLYRIFISLIFCSPSWKVLPVLPGLKIASIGKYTLTTPFSLTPILVSQKIRLILWETK